MYNGRLYDSLLVGRQTKKDYAEKKIKPQEILGPPETQHEHPPQFFAAEIQRPKEILAQELAQNDGRAQKARRR